MAKEHKKVKKRARTIVEPKVKKKEWDAVFAAITFYDLLDPALQPHSEHHTNIKKLRG